MSVSSSGVRKSAPPLRQRQSLTDEEKASSHAAAAAAGLLWSSHGITRKQYSLILISLTLSAFYLNIHSSFYTSTTSSPLNTDVDISSKESYNLKVKPTNNDLIVANENQDRRLHNFFKNLEFQKQEKVALDPEVNFNSIPTYLDNDPLGILQDSTPSTSQSENEKKGPEMSFNSSNTYLDNDQLQKLQFSIPSTSISDNKKGLNIHLSPVQTLERLLRQQKIQYGPEGKPIKDCSVLELYEALLDTSPMNFPVANNAFENSSPEKKDETNLKKVRCTSLMTEYDIIPFKSWGKAQTGIQKEWDSLGCNNYVGKDRKESEGWKKQKQKNQNLLKFWENDSAKKCNLENYNQEFNFQSIFSKEIDQHIESYRYGVKAEEIDRESERLRGVMGDDEYPIVSILAGVTTRGTSVKNIDDLVVINYLIPSLFSTIECGYRYNVVLGYDKGDQFYDNPVNQRELYLYFLKHFQIPLFLHANINFNLVLVEVDNVLRKPGPVFTEICKIGYFFLGSDWYFRVNDDSEILSQWTSPFIKAMKGLGYPYGVIGPLCRQGHTKILTHDFVHRTHMQIFDYDYYPPALVDWWMDDWISRVYGNTRTYQSKTIEMLHHTHAAGQRYKVDKSNERKLDSLVYSGKDKILQFMEDGPHPLEKSIIEKFKSSNFKKFPLKGAA